jgi:hypothetical protein
MLPNAFIGKLKKPTERELAEALGPSKELWDKLSNDLAQEHEVAVREWNSYSPKAGWSLRLKRKDRTIVYLSPCQGGFFVGFVLGDKAVKAARQSDLPKQVINIISEAKRYAEGTAVRMDVKNQKDIDVAKKLAAIKLAN